MSAGEHEPVDTVCPHGDDPQPPALHFVRDRDDGVGVIFDPENIGDGWIEADENAFIPIGRVRR